MEADFSGYATKAGLKCSDGRTITPEAFKHQDKMTVPLVWQHGHNDPNNVLGHMDLEARPTASTATATSTTRRRGRTRRRSSSTRTFVSSRSSPTVGREDDERREDRSPRSDP
jgi:hypothetical protein